MYILMLCLSYTIDEVPNNGITADTHTARLTVQREAGVFGPVTVTWSANGTMAADLDLTPTSGTVDFAEGQTTAVIDITTVDDQVRNTQCPQCATTHCTYTVYCVWSYSTVQSSYVALCTYLWRV